MTSNTEWGETTSALEVANTYAQQIEGKNGERVVVAEVSHF